MSGEVWKVLAYVRVEKIPEMEKKTEKNFTDKESATDSARKMAEENPDLYVYVSYTRRRDGVECYMNKEGNYDNVGSRW